MCAEKFPLVSMGGRAEGLACADPGARTPIGASGNVLLFFLVLVALRSPGASECSESATSSVKPVQDMLYTDHLLEMQTKTYQFTCNNLYQCGNTFSRLCM